MSSKLSTSFSFQQLKNISSYREQRMRSKPHLNCSQMPVSVTARKQLDHIQECLKSNTFSRRRASQGCLMMSDSGPEAIRLRKEIEGLQEPIVSDYLQDGENLRSKGGNRYGNDLNVIQENPFPQKKEITTGGLKARINLNHKPFTANNSKPSGKSESFLNDLGGSKQTPKANNMKKALIKHPTMGNSKVAQKTLSVKGEKLMKKLEALRDEFDKANLKKHFQIEAYFDRIAECLKDE